MGGDVSAADSFNGTGHGRCSVAKLLQSNRYKQEQYRYVQPPYSPTTRFDVSNLHQRSTFVNRGITNVQRESIVINQFNIIFVRFKSVLCCFHVSFIGFRISTRVFKSQNYTVINENVILVATVCDLTRITLKRYMRLKKKIPYNCNV